MVDSHEKFKHHRTMRLLLLRDYNITYDGVDIYNIIIYNTMLMCYFFVGEKLHLYTRMDIMLYNNMYPYSFFGGIIKTHACGFLY